MTIKTNLKNCFILSAGLAACGGVDNNVDTFLFELSPEEVHAASERASVIMETPAAYDAVTEQLIAPFECAKFGGLCEQVGQQRAPVVIEQMVRMLLDGTEAEVLHQAFSETIETAMDENDVDPRSDEPGAYAYNRIEKQRFNEFFESHYGYAPEKLPAADDGLAVQTSCSSKMESNTGKTFAFLTWSYWTNGKNFKNSGCSGGKKKRQTSLNGSMTHSCFDQPGGGLQDSQTITKSKSANTKKISVSWQPIWGTSSCWNEISWGATVSSSGGNAQTSDFHSRW